jgi:hypothetical protein
MPDLNLGVTGVMAPAKLVEEFNKWLDFALQKYDYIM